MNMTVQFVTPYTDPEHHNVQRHRQTDRQTDRWHHQAKKPIILCAVQSAKWPY